MENEMNWFEVVVNDELPRVMLMASSEMNASKLADDLFGVRNWLEILQA